VSRIGKQPIPIPDGVKVDLKGSQLKITGPKGTLDQEFDPIITITHADNEIVATRSTDATEHRAKHGLTRALINNMVVGVTHGFEKVLEIQGVGYRASIQGKNLNLALGYSHPITLDPPKGIELEVEGTNVIKVKGIDKQAVGQFAADIRAWRKPEPYKGKGIRYRGEYVRRKVGKAGVAAK
jgi:large subunit ribosomal protein L6